MPPPTADLEVARADRLVDQPDGADARRADLVDRLRGDLLRDPGLDLRLARGDLPRARLQHLAHDTCWTCSGATSARSSAASMAMPPRSVGCREDRPPPSLPTGVRAVPRITVRGMTLRVLRAAMRRAEPPPIQPRPTPAPTRSPSASSRARRSPTTSTAVLQALVDSGEAKPGAAQARGHPRGRQALRRSPASASATSSTPSAPAWPPPRSLGRAASSARARCAGSSRTTSATPRRRFVEGTLLAAYEYRAYKTERRRGRRAARGARRVRPPRRRAEVEPRRGRGRGRQRARATSRTPRRTR